MKHFKAVTFALFTAYFLLSAAAAFAAEVSGTGSIIGNIPNEQIRITAADGTTTDFGADDFSSRKDFMGAKTSVRTGETNCTFNTNKDGKVDKYTCSKPKDDMDLLLDELLR